MQEGVYDNFETITCSPPPALRNCLLTTWTHLLVELCSQALGEGRRLPNLQGQFDACAGKCFVSVNFVTLLLLDVTPQPTPSPLTNPSRYFLDVCAGR